MAETFTDFCAEWNVTPDERRKLAQHLATLRHAATMRLADPAQVDPRFPAAHYQDGRDLTHGVARNDDEVEEQRK